MTDSQSTHPVKTQALYRLFNADGELLYIGVSKSAIARLTQHLDTQPWADEIVHQRIERFAVTRTQIEQLEREAIIAEKPKYNVVHNGPRAKSAATIGFRCEVCRGEAAYVQVDMNETWHAFCKRHDDGCERYFIEAHRIATPEQVAKWTEHLSHKNWFDHGSWGRLVRSCGPKTARATKATTSDIVWIDEDAKFKVGDSVRLKQGGNTPGIGVVAKRIRSINYVDFPGQSYLWALCDNEIFAVSSEPACPGGINRVERQAIIEKHMSYGPEWYCWSTYGYEPGWLVEHPTYGKGRVISCEDDPVHGDVHVAFDNDEVAMRHLSIHWCPLRTVAE